MLGAYSGKYHAGPRSTNTLKNGADKDPHSQSGSSLSLPPGFSHQRPAFAVKGGERKGKAVAATGVGERAHGAEGGRAGSLNCPLCCHRA